MCACPRDPAGAWPRLDWSCPVWAVSAVADVGKYELPAAVWHRGHGPARVVARVVRQVANGLDDDGAGLLCLAVAVLELSDDSEAGGVVATKFAPRG